MVNPTCKAEAARTLAIVLPGQLNKTLSENKRAQNVVQWADPGFNPQYHTPTPKSKVLGGTNPELPTDPQLTPYLCLCCYFYIEGRSILLAPNFNSSIHSISTKISDSSDSYTIRLKSLLFNSNHLNVP